MNKKLKNYVKGVTSGNRRSLAKTITLIESISPKHKNLSEEIIHELLPKTGKTIRIGITGVPGVGKSTFIESFGMMLIKNGYKIAVLTIDPSSSISGGSILADKTRMKQLSANYNAFIRPSPSGGTLGGVSKMTRESILVCEAAGFDVIIVETVGVGQSETTVASMIDFFLVLMLANAGDELQGIKKGILEIADAIVINKADGDNIVKAEQAKKSYENAIKIVNSMSSNWLPPVLTCSAITSSGLNEVWQNILLHNKKLSKTGEFLKKRRTQSLDWMWSCIEDGLRDNFFKKKTVKHELSKITKAVEVGEISPTKGAKILLSLI